MTDVLWKTVLEPVIRKKLMDKYVPDTFVHTLTAYYWIFQELWDRRWRTGKRLTMDERQQVIQLIIWYFRKVAFEQQQAERYNYYAHVLIPMAETLSEEDICCDSFDESGHSIPHSIDVSDISCSETFDEIEYDTSISSETTEKIAQLVAACKEFKLKVTEDF